MTKNPEDKIVGWVLWHDDPAVWEVKLKFYDSIEKFDPQNYEGSWYKRDVVTAELEDGSTKECYIYHIPEAEVD